MPARVEYSLATVGRYDRRTHAITDRARELIACRGETPHLTRDDHGGFTDTSRTSELHPLGRSGVPTCARCRSALERF